MVYNSITQGSASAVGFICQLICTWQICEVVECRIEAMLVCNLCHYTYNMAPLSSHLTSSQICRKKAKHQHKSMLWYHHFENHQNYHMLDLACKSNWHQSNNQWNQQGNRDSWIWAGSHHSQPHFRMLASKHPWSTFCPLDRGMGAILGTAFLKNKA